MKVIDKGWAKPDDPIYKTGLTVSSAKSTPSTPHSQSGTDGANPPSTPAPQSDEEVMKLLDRKTRDQPAAFTPAARKALALMSWGADKKVPGDLTYEQKTELLQAMREHKLAPNMWKQTEALMNPAELRHIKMWIGVD